MFKKAVLLISIIVVVMSMGGCRSTSDKTDPKGEYEIITTDEYNLKVPSSEGGITKNYIDDADTAQSIADAVILSIVGEEYFNKLIGVNVAYDKKKELWIVNRNLGPTTLGGDYTCAIRRSNGEILKVWAGE